MSELFRIGLSRHDDYDLAGQSTVRSTRHVQHMTKNQKQVVNFQPISPAPYLAVYQKVLFDLNERERERTFREAGILKELSLINKIGNQTFI